MKGAAGFVRKRMVRDGIAYAVKAECFSMPPRRGFVARYTLTASSRPETVEHRRLNFEPMMYTVPGAADIDGAPN